MKSTVEGVMISMKVAIKNKNVNRSVTEFKFVMVYHMEWSLDYGSNDKIKSPTEVGSEVKTVV